MDFVWISAKILMRARTSAHIMRHNNCSLIAIVFVFLSVALALLFQKLDLKVYLDAKYHVDYALDSCEHRLGNVRCTIAFALIAAAARTAHTKRCFVLIV